MANDPTTAASGVRTITLDPGMTVSVTGATSQSKGSVSVMSPANTPETTDAIQGTATKSYGPYAEKRSVRLYSEVGRLDVVVASRLAALPVLQPAVISSDGKSASVQGTKPNTPVVFYDVDTGVILGTVSSAADGSATLTVRTPFANGQRIGYDPTVVGPYTVVGGVVAAPGQVTNLSVGTTTQTSAPLAWTLPSDGGAPTSVLVEYKKTGDSTWTTATSSAPGNSTSYTVTGLQSASPYQFRVTAVNQAGPGTPSAVASASTASGSTPSTPGSLDFSKPENSGLVPTV